MLEVPWSAANQVLEIQTSDIPSNLTGRIVTVRVSGRGSAMAFVKTGASVVRANGPIVDLNGGVATITLNVDSPDAVSGSPYDPSSVIAVGFEITSASSTPETVRIDGFCY